MGKPQGTAGRTMARGMYRLTDRKVKTEKRPGLYADGGSLYLRVAEGGSKQWVFRFVVNGRMRDMGMGSVYTLTLAEAREKAREARKLLLEGIDPIERRKAHRAAAVAADAGIKTFRECGEQYIREHAKKWTNPKHGEQWKSTLESYVYPVLGKLPVGTIDTPLVLKILKPLWERAPVTASRVRGRIEQILGWATVHHYRGGPNPAQWRGHLQHALPALSQIAQVEHHAALPYTEAPDFMAKLQQNSSVAARCLEFIALTAVRMTEATDATWDEIDLATTTWTIPGSRMKNGEEHRVPLSDATVRALAQMREIRTSAYVFPGLRAGRPIGRNAVWELGKMLGTTVHGLRSTFRDWAAERTNFPREVAEMALAHAIPNAVEAAYRRGDLFDKRRKLMQAWAEFCGKPQSGRGAPGGQV
jgi:integrase